jgi:hypothetical protein
LGSGFGFSAIATVYTICDALSPEQQVQYIAPGRPGDSHED